MRLMRLMRLAALVCVVWYLFVAGPAGADTGGGPLTIIALGDSLTAGYNLEPGASFPEQLERALRARGHDVRVENAGVSGDTTQGGLARLDWSVPDYADAVIIALGGNDALRGISPSTTRDNLMKIASGLEARALPFMLAGIAAPTSMGGDYARAFNAVFGEVARHYDVPLRENFLGDIPPTREFVQADGMHPTAAGVAQMVGHILPQIEILMARARNAGQAGQENNAGQAGQR